MPLPLILGTALSAGASGAVSSFVSKLFGGGEGSGVSNSQSDLAAVQAVTAGQQNRIQNYFVYEDLRNQILQEETGKAINENLAGLSQLPADSPQAAKAEGVIGKFTNTVAEILEGFKLSNDRKSFRTFTPPRNFTEEEQSKINSALDETTTAINNFVSEYKQTKERPTTGISEILPATSFSSGSVSAISGVIILIIIFLLIRRA